MKLAKLCFALMLITIQCKAQQDTRKLELEIQKEEAAHPMKYLHVLQVKSVKNINKTNRPFQRPEYNTDGWNVSGFINNSASFTNYKDAVIRIAFYTQTNTLLDTQSFTLYHFYKSRSNVPFLQKVYPPDNATQVLVMVVGATAY